MAFSFKDALNNAKKAVSNVASKAATSFSSALKSIATPSYASKLQTGSNVSPASLGNINSNALSGLSVNRSTNTLAPKSPTGTTLSTYTPSSTFSGASTAGRAAGQSINLGQAPTISLPKFEIKSASPSMLDSMMKSIPSYDFNYNTSQPSAGINQTLKTMSNPQFLNFKELLNNVKNAHQGSWGSMDIGLTEFLKPSIAYAADETRTRLPGVSLGDTSNAGFDTMLSKPIEFPTATGPLSGNSLWNGAKTAYDKAIGTEGDTQNEISDLFVSLGDENTKYEDEIRKLLANGYTDEAAVLDEARKKNEERVRNQYKLLVGEYDALIPEYERTATQGEADINSDLARLKTTGGVQKENLSNTYGDLLRRNIANAQSEDLKLRNSFSQLGTADSSAYMDKAFQQSKTLQDTQTSTEREMNQKLSLVDSQLQANEEDAVRKIEEIKADRDSKVDSVRRSKLAGTQAETDALDQINQTFAQQIAEAKAAQRNAQIDLVNQRQQLANTMSTILAQGGVDQGLLDKTYALESGLSNTTNEVTQAADYKDVLPSLQTAAKGYSTITDPNRKALIKQQWKSKYPQYADLIDQLFDSQTPNNYLA